LKIDLSNVHKFFDGGVRALDGVSLHVPSGARVALVGPNGSGKSTLVRAIMGLVRCDGISLDHLDPFTHRAELAARIAYVPQTAPLLAASVNEVVAAVAAVRCIDDAEIRAVARALRFDIAGASKRPVRALSGGMKQKLLLSLALSARASLYVLDEPTASLEAVAREAFFEVFETRANGATLVLSSHRADEIARLARRVVALEEGRGVRDESTSSWLAQSAEPTILRPQEVYA